MINPFSKSETPTRDANANAIAVAPAPRHRSHAAAEAAARWEALERELDTLQHNLQLSDGTNAVLKQTNNVLTSEIASLRFENERLVRENTAIQTRVNIAAETLIAIRTATQDSNASAAQGAVENALNEIEPKADAETVMWSPTNGQQEKAGGK